MAQGDSIHILVIDDDEDDFIILDDLLSEASENKYALGWAQTYDEGLQLAAQDAHQVIVLDYQLGNKTGLDLLRSLRNTGSQLPVIMLTGAANYDVDVSAMELGATAFLDKNELTFQQIDRAIRYSLSQYSQLKYHQDLSITDALTGLHNRRGLTALSEHQFRLAERDEGELCLLLMDLDDFKQVNDTHGHQEGDRHLVAFADALRVTFRATDILSRPGGDEFAVLLVQANATEHQKYLERLDAEVQTFNKQHGSQHPLAYSVGVACHKPGAPFSLDLLISAADEKLYAMKTERKAQR